MLRYVLGILFAVGLGAQANAAVTLDGTDVGVEQSIGGFLVPVSNSGAGIASQIFTIGVDPDPVGPVQLIARAISGLGPIEFILEVVGGPFGGLAIGDNSTPAVLTIAPAAFAGLNTIDLQVQATVPAGASLSGGIQVVGVVTPIPAALALFGTALAGLGAARSRRSGKVPA